MLLENNKNYIILFKGDNHALQKIIELPNPEFNSLMTLIKNINTIRNTLISKAINVVRFDIALWNARKKKTAGGLLKPIYYNFVFPKRGLIADFLYNERLKEQCYVIFRTIIEKHRALLEKLRSIEILRRYLDRNLENFIYLDLISGVRKLKDITSRLILPPTPITPLEKAPEEDIVSAGITSDITEEREEHPSREALMTPPPLHTIKRRHKVVTLPEATGLLQLIRTKKGQLKKTITTPSQEQRRPTQRNLLKQLKKAMELRREAMKSQEEKEEEKASDNWSDTENTEKE